MVEYNVNSLKFAVQLSLLKIDGMYPKHGKTGNGKIFDIKILKEYFNIQNENMFL
jgi:hypothetical protein